MQHIVVVVNIFEEERTILQLLISEKEMELLTLHRLTDRLWLHSCQLAVFDGFVNAPELASYFITDARERQHFVEVFKVKLYPV